MTEEIEQINIIHIPSWYPTESNPISGIFIKEFIEGIAKFDLNVNHIILTPIDTLHFLRHSLFKPRKKYEAGLNQVSKNLFEFNSNLLLMPKVSRIQYWRLIDKQFNQLLKLFKGKFLIHAHVGFEAGIFALKLKQRYNIHYVITEHMSTFPFPNILKNRKKSEQLKKAFQGAKKIISVSQNQAKEIVEFCDCKAIVISNTINKNLFSIKKNLDTFDKTTFLTICIPSHQKALDILFKSIQLLDTRIRNNSKFIIAGGGALWNEYKNLSLNLGLTDCVEMIGQVDRSEIPSLFSKSNIFILISRYESFGIVYIESLASGVPIIASKNGGAQEIVNDKNGILVDIEDISATKSAIEFMFDNYSKYDANEIRLDFENRFSQEVSYSKFISIYKDLNLFNN